MPTSPQGFATRIAELKAELVAQGRRVQRLVEAAYDSAFAGDPAAALAATAMDEGVDRADVEIERRSVALLTDACSEGAALSPEQLRLVLTIVKVNNELERIADVGTFVAELVPALQTCTAGRPAEGAMAEAGGLPPTFRVLANSVIGIIRDCVSSLDRVDGELAKVVLLSESAVGEFKRALVADAQSQLQSGRMGLPITAALHEIAAHSVALADHCSNIAEQVLYVSTGRIMRHMQGRWQEVKIGG